MNDRERFVATMHYQPRDRAPLYDFNFWDETVPAWHMQGLATRWNRGNVREFFGLDCSLCGGEPPNWSAGVNVDLCPLFESKIIEDAGDEYTLVQSDGVIVRKQRSSVSIPMHVGHTLVDRDSWRKHYLPKLQPDSAGRFPVDWEQRIAAWKDPNRSHPVFLNGGSFIGRIRDWMGIENLALAIYDEPEWFGEMVETMADLVLAMLGKAFASGVQFDACGMWEDICYRAGPLISPGHFKQFIMPHYRRLSDLCHRHGVDVIWLDCDGKIDDLIPLWLDNGINCMFPIEIGNWGADPVRYRKQFGKNLLMMGGFDKHILAQSRDAIEAEVIRLMPLVEEGGYIPFADHRVPPDVPLENYIHYAKLARKHWGKGVSLRPMAAASQGHLMGAHS